MNRLHSVAIGMLAALSVGAHASAAPIMYRVNMGVPANSDPKLTGGQLELTLSWDHEGLTPLSDDGSIVDERWTTSWPVTNTTASIKITGTPAHNGVYPGAPSSTDASWIYYNNSQIFGDALQYPRLEFPFVGGTITVLGVQARFPNEFFQNLSTITPKSFAGNELTLLGGVLLTGEPPVRGAAMNVSGFAVAVPEPSTLVTGTLALAGVAALRRRS